MICAASVPREYLVTVEVPVLPDGRYELRQIL